MSIAERLNSLNPIERVHSYVKGYRLPTQETQGYVSYSGVYGAHMQYDEGGQLYLRYEGFMPWLDATGDYILRTVDDNLINDPVKMAHRRPKDFLKQVFKGPKRYRGDLNEIVYNIYRLGLETHYTPRLNEQNHIVGININNNFWEDCITLKNIYKAQAGGIEAIDEHNTQGLEILKNIDRFQALEAATRYLRHVHDTKGPIGEVTDDFYFTSYDEKENKVQEPILGIPDIVWNDKVVQNDLTKRATDLAEFLICFAHLETDVSGDPDAILRSLQLILETYGDPEVIRTARSFIKRGRLTFSGDTRAVGKTNLSEYSLDDSISNRSRNIFGVHNDVRLGSNPEMVPFFKDCILLVCDEYLASLKTQQ